MINELTVNWHITEACNFKCQYCFAKWDRDCKKELLHSEEKVSLLLNELEKLPVILGFDKLRLNLVGGETFLYRKAVENIIKEAKERCIRLSVITNGSMLDDDLNHTIASYFDIIGFSVDSLVPSTNMKIGRESKGLPVDTHKIITDIEFIKKLNPSVKIKVNTVVNKLNFTEFLGDFISQVKPDKWKVFKMLPIVNSDLEISDDEFSTFLNRHEEFKGIISAEDNNEMTQSYLMIDSVGRFFQNRLGEKGYLYSQPIIDVGIEKSLSQIPFDIEKFNGRYSDVVI